MGNPVISDGGEDSFPACNSETNVQEDIVQVCTSFSLFQFSCLFGDEKEMYPHRLVGGLVKIYGGHDNLRCRSLLVGWGGGGGWGGLY